MTAIFKTIPKNEHTGDELTYITASQTFPYENSDNTNSPIYYKGCLEIVYSKIRELCFDNNVIGVFAESVDVIPQKDETDKHSYFDNYNTQIVTNLKEFKHSKYRQGFTIKITMYVGINNNQENNETSV